MTRGQAIAALLVLGAGWGMTIPMTKLAVSTGYGHFGLIFWQCVIGVVLLGAILAIRGRLPRITRAHLLVWAVIALLGTLLPNSASYQAAAELPAGVMAIAIATVPMFAFPIALLLGSDRFGWTRFSGLMLGLAGVVVLAAPGAAQASAFLSVWVLVALIAPFFYGIEGNVVAKYGTAGLDPVQVLFGASVLGACLCLPLALGSGQFIDPRPPYGIADLGLLLTCAIHALVYSGYVALVGRAGAVFSAQVSYLVTAFGVLWSMLILGERYDGTVWAALALMCGGLFLVQPRNVRRGLVGA